MPGGGGISRGSLSPVCGVKEGIDERTGTERAGSTCKSLR
jgi:hypothetical protein